MNAMFGDPWTTSGGKALAFHASVRLRLKGMGQIKQKVNGKDKTVGMKVRCQVIKNRMGPPLSAADFEIYFERGIDNYGAWLTVLKEHKLVKSGGAWYTLTDQNGKDHKFLSKDWEDLITSDDELREYVYKIICDKVILQYKEKLGIDDVEFTDEVLGD